MKPPKLSNLTVDVKGTKALRKSIAKAKKVKITVNVDDDVLTTLKTMASGSGIPYQTLLNRFLKEALSKRQDESSRLEKIEREIERIKKKISA